jgi:hypothetical protein
VPVLKADSTAPTYAEWLPVAEAIVDSINFDE